MLSSADLVRPGFELQRTGESDRYFDYCLQPYTPRRTPTGKLRAENLLWRSLELAGLLDRAREPLLALQRSLGRDMTVWGAKYDGQRLFWELYFYDPQKEDAAATVTGLTRTLAPWLRIAPAVDEKVPYMMVSFDIDAEVLESARIDVLNLYLAGTAVHEGRSYRVKAGQTPELENIYRFLEPKREIDTLLPLLTTSMWVDYTSDKRTLPKVLIPELFACKRACIAKKRYRDGIYFSGIDIEQLLFFLRRFGYPPELLSFAERHAGDLDHLFFDVGIDYDMTADGGIAYPKTSFYGTL